jgi:hypothetical protein
MNKDKYCQYAFPSLQRTDPPWQTQMTKSTGARGWLAPLMSAHTACHSRSRLKSTLKGPSESVLCWVADLGKKRQLPATRCFTFKPKGGKRRTTPGFKRREKMKQSKTVQQMQETALRCLWQTRQCLPVCFHKMESLLGNLAWQTGNWRIWSVLARNLNSVAFKATTRLQG